MRPGEGSESGLTRKTTGPGVMAQWAQAAVRKTIRGQSWRAEIGVLEISV